MHPVSGTSAMLPLKPGRPAFGFSCVYIYSSLRQDYCNLVQCIPDWSVCRERLQGNHSNLRRQLQYRHHQQQGPGRILQGVLGFGDRDMWDDSTRGHSTQVGVRGDAARKVRGNEHNSCMCECVGVSVCAACAVVAAGICGMIGRSPKGVRFIYLLLYCSANLDRRLFDPCGQIGRCRNFGTW